MADSALILIMNFRKMRIVFFHQGRINDWAGAVLGGLKSQFPEAEVLVFDLHQLVKDRLGVLALNAAAAGMRYAGDLVRRRRDLDDAFFTTPYIFRKVREISTQIHAKYPSDFSFQMHSMHDHSSPHRPHFVYTDFTYRSCRDNAFYGKYRWVPTRSDQLIENETEIYLNSECTFSQTGSVVRTLINDYGIPFEKALNVCYGPNINAITLRAIVCDVSRYRSKTVLFIGNDWERKGGPELVQAFNLVRRKIPDAKLLIVGCEPKLDIDGVEVMGKIPLMQLPDYYARASVFCMPSKLEPSAGVYVEAMHAGLPVVALDTKETREIVRNAVSGFLVPFSDVVGMGERLSALLSSPELCESMGRNGRQSARENHTWEQTFSKIGTRIRFCINQKREDQIEVKSSNI